MSQNSRPLRGGPGRPLPHEPADPATPEHWNRPSALLDLEDRKLRTLAHSLVASCQTERERAVAIYRHVRRIPLAAARKLRLRGARAVMERDGGDAVDKATLFVALLRIVGLPARLLFAATYQGVLRGLPADVACMPRPIVEVWIAKSWVRTDTYIFDEAYLNAARYRLQKEREDYGYGVCASGSVDWDGRRHAYVLGVEQEDLWSDEDTRAYHDPAEFAQSLRTRQRLALLARLLYWNTLASRLDDVLRRTRARQPRPMARRKSKARRGATAGLSRTAVAPSVV